LNLHKLRSQFIWVDPEMTSDLFATSFYMPELQAPDRIEDGANYPLFEMITLRNPLISNTIDYWMTIPLFDQMLSEMYMQMHQATHALQKQRHQ
jgi:hypothetical protein